MTSPAFFSDIINPLFNTGAVMKLSPEDKVLIISDLHMGSGKRDDLANNGNFLADILEGYYLENGWTLVLNGDIEELLRYSLEEIRERWARLYGLYDRFAIEDRFYKILGNHDEGLSLAKGYPYPLYNALRIDTDLVPIYIFHGHQSSKIYTRYSALILMGFRFLLKPFGIRNISSSRSPRRRFEVEKQAYRFSIDNHCISIIGHTHRALFESLGRFDYIKFEIERLCRDYTLAEGHEKERIAKEVSQLHFELGKLKRSERRDVLRQSLYGDEVPIPCLFNSGSAISKKGINAIEIENNNISLIYWFIEGKGKKFVSRGGYKVERFKDSPYRKAVLNQDRLDCVKAKIDLLGSIKSGE